MRTLPIFLWVGLPLVVGLTARLWFWKIRYISSLSGPPTGKNFDDEAVTLTAAPNVTIRTLRSCDGGRVGKKIVVMHHLREHAEEVVDEISITATASLIFTLLVVVFVATVALPDPPSEPKSISMLAQLREDSLAVLNALPKIYLAPYGPAAASFWQACLIVSLRKQVRRLKEVL